MTLTFSNLSRCIGMVVTALMCAMPTASQGYALEQEQMCSGDAMRLCLSEIPNVERSTACMERQRESLSEGCRAVFEVDTPAAAETPVNDTQAAKPSKPMTLTPKLRRG
jgi:hypothetical protein